jgi:hypothetical protein
MGEGYPLPPESGGDAHKWFSKEWFKTWAQKEINDWNFLRSRILLLEQRVNALANAGVGVGAGTGQTLPSAEAPEITEVRDWTHEIDAEKEYRDLLKEIPDIEKPPRTAGEEGYSVEDLVKATYSLHQLTHAMRGYLLLVDQLGLSKDQKKMVRQFEYLFMSITKLTTALNIFYSVYTKVIAGEAVAAPELMIPLFVMGGLGSASFGYGLKLNAGTV